MSKEFFAHQETRQLFQTVEDIARRSKVSRGQAFEDVIRATVCALAAETMEEEYFEAIKAHTQGKQGERGVDLFPKFFGQTVDAMTRTDDDVLGDLFQGAISYGEHALYITPQPIAELMARVTVEASDETGDGDRQIICDPCCGPGVLLIEAGRIKPRAELVGQDIDARCANIAAVNLGLRSKYGWIICGNTLSRETQFVYRIGSFYHESPNGLRRGVIRQVPPGECPVLPELRKRTNRDLLGAIEEEPLADPPAEQQRPSIIEIPDWALRLEQRLASNEQAEASEQQSAPSTPVSPTQAVKETTPQEEAGDSDDGPPKNRQQELF